MSDAQHHYFLIGVVQICNDCDVFMILWCLHVLIILSHFMFMKNFLDFTNALS